MVALSTFHALVFTGVTGKKWRRDPTNQPPAHSNSNERVPRTEANLAFKRKESRGRSRRRSLPCTFTRVTYKAGEVNWLAALSGSWWMYLVFTCPSPDVTGRDIRHPCFFTNLRGATLMWICRTLLWKGLVSAGDAFWRQCLVTDKIINGAGWGSSLYIKGWEGSGDIGSCW